MPPFHEDVKAAFKGHNRLAEVVGEIAKGRDDCGRPIPCVIARQMARDVMIELGLRWPTSTKGTGDAA